MEILKISDGGCWKVTTSHGTHYVIDLDHGRGKRMPAEHRGRMYVDNKWFGIRDINCVVGNKMIIDLEYYDSERPYPWILTTIVTSIEPYSESN